MGRGRQDRRKRKRAKLVARIAELELWQVYARNELADTDAHVAEMREREARHRGDPRPWWEQTNDTEGGCPL